MRIACHLDCSPAASARFGIRRAGADPAPLGVASALTCLSFPEWDEAFAAPNLSDFRNISVLQHWSFLS
jgi:hypothetical protein